MKMTSTNANPVRVKMAAPVATLLVGSAAAAHLDTMEQAVKIVRPSCTFFYKSHLYDFLFYSMQRWDIWIELPGDLQV